MQSTITQLSLLLLSTHTANDDICKSKYTNEPNHIFVMHSSSTDPSEQGICLTTGRLLAMDIV